MPFCAGLPWQAQETKLSGCSQEKAIPQVVLGLESNLAGGAQTELRGRKGSGFGLAAGTWGDRVRRELTGMESTAQSHGEHSSQISLLRGRNCLLLFSKLLPEEDVLQVVILGLLPVTLSKVLPVLTEQVMLIPVPISSVSLLSLCTSSSTGAVQQVTRGAQTGH